MIKLTANQFEILDIKNNVQNRGVMNRPFPANNPDNDGLWCDFSVTLSGGSEIRGFRKLESLGLGRLHSIQPFVGGSFFRPRKELMEFVEAQAK
jgi:hypothetical protein